MYGGSKASEAVVKSEGVGRGSVDNQIRSFCKSLVRGIHLNKSSATRDQNEVAIDALDAPELGQPVHPRVIKQGHSIGGRSLLLRTAQSRLRELA